MGNWFGTDAVIFNDDDAYCQRAKRIKIWIIYTGDFFISYDDNSYTKYASSLK